jgi:hypothetical protein
MSDQVHTNEMASLGVYFHLEYPQFCWDNHQCRDNFQVYLNQTFDKLSDRFRFEPFDNQSFERIELMRCTLIGKHRELVTTRILLMMKIDLVL